MVDVLRIAKHLRQDAPDFKAVLAGRIELGQPLPRKIDSAFATCLPVLTRQPIELKKQKPLVSPSGFEISIDFKFLLNLFPAYIHSGRCTGEPRGVQQLFTP